MRPRLRPEEILLLVLSVVVVVLVSAARVWRLPTPGQAFTLLVLLVLITLAPRRQMARDALPLIAILALYGCLHDVTPAMFPRPFDELLAALDRALFGVDLAVFASRFATPSLTAVMLFCYLSYFVAPAILAIVLYRQDSRVAFRDYVVSLSCVAALAYVGYLAMPVVGPYAYQAAVFPNKLPGNDATRQALDLLEALHGDARDGFPSLHTAATTCVLVIAWRHARLFFVAYLPIAIGLVMSTVYLRYHYGADVIAGFATAGAGILLGGRLQRSTS